MGNNDAFLYSAFYCAHAMFQIGGRHWAEFYLVLTKTLLDNQRPDGSWPPEVGRGDIYGSAYATALAILTLSVPDQLLPIFQR